MLSLLPISKVITGIAVLYAGTMMAIFWYLLSSGESFTMWESIQLAFGGATVLQLTVFMAFALGWKCLWTLFPVFNRWLFPNLSGNWSMEIHWHHDGKTGIVPATATIRQDFLRISIEVAAPGSDSETLVAIPKRDPESGRPILYYQYRVVPKNIGKKLQGPYHGAAILRFSQNGNGELNGNYFTSSLSGGHFKLNRPL